MGMGAIGDIPDGIAGAGVAIAFRGSVSVVQMGGHRGNAEAAILAYGRKRIDVSRELGPAVKGLIGRARTGGVNAIIKPPNGLRREVGRLDDLYCTLPELVERPWNHRESRGVDHRRLQRSRPNP